MLKVSKKTGTVFAVFLAIILFISFLYHGESDTLRTVDGGGVVLTFDDMNIDDWYQADKVLDKYGWKATFFISHYYSLDEQQKNKLSELQAKGHEIGSHSNKHLNASHFISDNSIDEYVATDILPSINQMKKEGFDVTSFAYPYGARATPVPFDSRFITKLRNKFLKSRINDLDRAILGHFTMLRGTVYGSKEPAIQQNYASGKRLVFGLGIDENYGNDIEYLYRLLHYAKENNKIVIFYAHQVKLDAASKKYTITYEKLERLCDYVQKNDMHFMTMRELAE